jgi:hypothetical protein
MTIGREIFISKSFSSEDFNLGAFKRIINCRECVPIAIVADTVIDAASLLCRSYAITANEFCDACFDKKPSNEPMLPTSYKTTATKDESSSY